MDNKLIKVTNWDDLNGLYSDDGTYSIIKHIDEWYDVVDTDEGVVVATIDLKHFNLRETIKMLVKLWDFNIEYHKEYTYFVGYIYYDTVDTQDVIDSCILTVKEQIVTPNQLKKLAELIPHENQIVNIRVINLNLL